MAGDSSYCEHSSVVSSTVLAEWSTQLGKETSTFERILAHLGRGGQGEGVRLGEGDRVRGERGERGKNIC